MKGIAIRLAGKDYDHEIAKLRVVGYAEESSWKGCGKPGLHVFGGRAVRLSASLIDIFALAHPVQQGDRLLIGRESLMTHIVDTWGYSITRLAAKQPACKPVASTRNTWLPHRKIALAPNQIDINHRMTRASWLSIARAADPLELPDTQSLVSGHSHLQSRSHR